VAFLAQCLANPVTISGVVLLLFLWAIFSGTRFYARTAKLISTLKDARVVVEKPEFLGSFEATAQQFAALPLLGGSWSAYYDTLIVHGDNAAPRPVRSTLRPDRVFDSGLLRVADIKPRYHAAMPGMLVGAGLLFTFLGLTVALSVAGDVVAGGDNAQRQQGLHQLLNVASFKFLTSLAGLGLSIAYTWFRNYRIRLVEPALDGFNAALERQMPLATPAFLQHEVNETLRNQSAALEIFGNQLAVSIGEKLDSAFDQRLGEHIGPLTAAMQALVNRISTQNEDAIQKMMHAIIDRLSGGTRDHLAGVIDNLAALGTRLEGLQSGLGEASARIAQSAEAMAARMGEGAEAALTRITDQMGDLMETLRSVTAQTRDAGAEAAQALAADGGRGCRIRSGRHAHDRDAGAGRGRDERGTRAGRGQSSWKSGNRGGRGPRNAGDRWPVFDPAGQRPGGDSREACHAYRRTRPCDKGGDCTLCRRSRRPASDCGSRASGDHPAGASCERS
jgi:hypothetical protein